MSDFTSFTLWRQQEARLSHELEIKRAVEERLSEEKAEQERSVADSARETECVQGVPAADEGETPTAGADTTPAAVPAEPTSEPTRELIVR